MTPKKTEKLVGEYARRAGAGFMFEDLVEYIQKNKGTTDENEIREHALRCEDLFDLEGELFIPRQSFFHGAQFRATPSAREIEGGFLVPGHRFMPFCSRRVHPAETHLNLPDGSRAKTKLVSLPQEWVMDTHAFFGIPEALEILFADSNENQAALRPPFEDDLKVRVFDLRDFFSACAFQPGDSLMLTVMDWRKGIFSVERAEQVNDLTATRKWCESLDDALDFIISDEGPHCDCYEQLSLAMLYTHDDPEWVSLTETPPLSIPVYYTQQEELAAKKVLGRALFWPVDEDPMQALAEDAVFGEEEALDGKTEMDAFFQALGLSVSEEDAEGYIRDALFQGQEDPNLPLARILRDRDLFFDSPEESERFLLLWRELWERVQSNYSREEDAGAVVRSRLLKINDRILAILRGMDRTGSVFVDLMENPDFLQLAEFSSVISEGIRAFNSPLETDLPPDEAIEELFGKFTETIDALEKDLFAPAAIYQLKVSIKDSKPPIWRRILVPSNMELAGLHFAIQAAMGWTNSHMHQFRKGRICYRPPEMLDGFLDCDDYDGMRIADLLRREKEKVFYEYDFGDSWEHVVLLEKIVDPVEGQRYPVCIKGKRACPPEDCGGIWGYYRLLEIMDDPDDPEYDNMLDWYGEIAPDAFSLAEANARLKSCFE